jgi:hypothetical protein
MERPPPLPAAPPELTLARLAELAELALADSRRRHRHAAVAFTTDGVVVVSREDVGRHNAVDKAGRSPPARRPAPARPRPGRPSRAASNREGWSAGFPHRGVSAPTAPPSPPPGGPA